MKGGKFVQILTRAVHIIDYEGETVHNRSTPATFDEYVSELISHINSNIRVRKYKTRSNSTEIINCIRQIRRSQASAEVSNPDFDAIARRLLLSESEAQNRVAHLTNVQKGSLIQALLFDEASGSFKYLLAKVEHSGFVDDGDFSFKTGFSKDKKTIWKSCLFDLTSENEEVYYANIYSNTSAKYWSESFLELDELVTDEKNTRTAFKCLDAYLNNNIKSTAPRDHTIIRNAIVAYFKSNEHFDYDVMLETVLGQYTPTDLSNEKLDILRSELLQLPDKKDFERQFNSIVSDIDERISVTYEVNNSVKIRVTDAIQDIAQTIVAYTGADGVQYIRIRVTNQDTFQRFANNNQNSR